jgi:hypothetical protein
VDALYLHGGAPAFAQEVELGDELVGPACDDGLASGVTRRMVVETTFGTALRVAARPHTHVHGVDGRSASSKRMAGEQPPQSFSIDSSLVQRGVKAAPAAAMRRFEAQVNGRTDGVRGKDGVGEFEESVASAVEAIVERVAEGV